MKRARKEELDGKWKKVATRAVTDDKFKDKLVADPLKTLGEFDLSVPENVEVLVGHANTITLVEPKDAPEELSKEVRWWRVRLDMIQEFGKEERSGTAGGPIQDDEDV